MQNVNMRKFEDSHPSEKFRYCPACGDDNLCFDSRKLFSCGKCGFTLYINPATAVAAIIETGDGRIVLTRRKHEPRAGFLDLPGGFVDPNESAENALSREIFEELGIKINSARLFATAPNKYIFNGLLYFTCDLGFICRSEELGRIIPADDVSEAILVRPEDINFKEIGFPSIVNILQRYIMQKSRE